MNNHILYRAWLPVLQEMVKARALYFFDDGKIAMKYYNKDNELCADSDKYFELMRCTGEVDVHDNLIYEGDIIMAFNTYGIIVYGDNSYPNEYNIIMGNIGFYIKWICAHSKLLNNEILFWTRNKNGNIMVVGNIHENPELLKQGGE